MDQRLNIDVRCELHKKQIYNNKLRNTSTKNLIQKSNLSKSKIDKSILNYITKQTMSYTSYRHQMFKYKKRLPIKSLQAAICNVALFKNMKEKQFRDSIYISYCQQGVILQALSLAEWERACDYVLDFLYDKKIALLTYGYEKQVYEELIAKGLKEYTRRIKEQGDECPYINIIHYQKLRKSCEYMDKEKYMDPLKYWQSKFKTNPNFSFLIVEPKSKFYEVKRYLLQFLLKRQVSLKIEYVTLWEFLYLFYNSKNKDEIRELCDKKIIEAQVVKKAEEDEMGQWYKPKSQIKKSDETSSKDQKFPYMKPLTESDYIVKLVNYSDLILNEYDVKIIKHTPNLAKLGLEYISSKEIQKEIKTVTKYLRGPETSQELTQNPQQKKMPTLLDIYDNLHQEILSSIKNDSSQPAQETLYSMIPYKKCEKEKYLTLLDKLLKTATEIKNKNLEQINNELKKLSICEYDAIEFLSILPLKKIHSSHSSKKKLQQEKYHVYKASINDCPYMVIEYHQVPIDDLDTFVLYLEQLKTYYCSYLVRFYGISIRYGENVHQSHAEILSQINPTLLEKIQKSQSHSYKELSKSKLQEYSYYLIFDYHHRNLQTLIENDFILDNLQIANIALQILYLCQYLHEHDEPRCLGLINLEEIYWPLALVLPYLGQRQQPIFKEASKKRGKTLKFKNITQFKLNCSEQGFEGDVKLAGLLIEHLMTAQNPIDQSDEESQSSSNESIDYDDDTIDKELMNLWKLMKKENKYDRITLAKAISTLEDILSSDQKNFVETYQQIQVKINQRTCHLQL